MKRKPKIAVIGLKGLPAYGGAATVGENIIMRLKGHIDFTIYSTSSHTDLTTGKYDGYNQIVFSKLPFKRLNTLFYYMLSAMHTTFCGKYDLVHLHHRDAAFILLILKLKYKIIITTHGSFFYSPKWKTFKWFFHANEKYFVKYADIRTCVSLQEKRLYKEKLGLPFHHIPNGINIKKNQSRCHLAGNKSYLFFGAGRIIKTKGLETLLRSLKKVNCEIPLYVAGDLNQTNAYKREIIILSQGLNVKFLGLIKDKSLLMDYVRNAKLFIFPSSNEAMSMMLLEAVSAKIPVIASDIVQNLDIFSPQEILYFQTDNHEDLSNKINYAIKNQNVMNNKAENAYLRCLEEYNWNKIALKYNLLYESMITSNK